MFDPAALEIRNEVHRPDPWFVGIRKRGDVVEFCLPQGFQDYPIQVRQERRDLFFQLYQTLRIFQDGIAGRRWESNSTEDTGLHSKGGATFTTKDGEEEVTLYAKIPALEAVLDGYDSLRIFRLAARPQRTQDVDYSKLHRYLDRAVYMEDHTAYIDEMVLPTQTLTYAETDIVEMFCFIYAEVKQALGETSDMRPEVSAYGQKFRHNHLYPDSSLFSDAHDRTVQLLKRLLNKIHLETGYKDDDYWHFYDAIETFLFGALDPNEDGVLWGISTFAPVWEDMCLTWVFRNGESKRSVQFADPDRHTLCNHRLPDGQRVYKKDDFESPFYIERRDIRRYMRPDLVRGSSATDRDVLDHYFSIRHRNGKCHIRLKQKNKNGRAYFRQLVKKISETWGGAKRPSRNAEEWSFSIPEQAMSLLEKPKEGVRQMIKKKHSGNWTIHDFKYKPASLYQDGIRSRETADIRKQLVYEYALHSVLPNSASTKSVLEVPRFFPQKPDEISKEVKDERLHHIVQKAEVTIAEVDYLTVQDVYHKKMNMGMQANE